MKLESKWYSAARGTLIGAVLLLGLTWVMPGALFGIFLVLGLLALASFGVICRRHLRCPNCGRFILPWFPMEETQYCRACGFHFAWESGRWWEKAD